MADCSAIIKLVLGKKVPISVFLVVVRPKIGTFFRPLALPCTITKTWGIMPERRRGGGLEGGSRQSGALLLPAIQEDLRRTPKDA